MGDFTVIEKFCKKHSLYKMIDNVNINIDRFCITYTCICYDQKHYKGINYKKINVPF